MCNFPFGAYSFSFKLQTKIPPATRNDGQCGFNSSFHSIAYGHLNSNEETTKYEKWTNLFLSSKLTTSSILLRIPRDKGVSWGPFAFSHLFQDLGVPAGISYIEMKQSGGKRAYARDSEEPQILSDDIHAKLLDLVSVDSTRKAKKTRRHNVNDKKKTTKKNKI